MPAVPLFLFSIELLLLSSSSLANGYLDLGDELEQCKPQQIHIAYGSSVSEMVIIWSTPGLCDSSVKYGTLPQKLDTTAPGEDRMFESDWNKDGVKYMHIVRLRGLTPKTVYYYQASSNGIQEGPFYFYTPASDHSENVKFMAISDLNTTSPIMRKLLDEAEMGKYKALLHAGNIAMRLSDEGGKNGDLYMKLMSMAIKSTPYMTAPGFSESDGGSFAQYTHRFAMPKTEWPMHLDTLWYSIDIGLVHLVSFSTEVYSTNDGKYRTTQHDWFIKDLKVANENRDRVPWIVVFGHRPFYCSSRDPELSCNKNKSEIRTDLEDIMFHYGVDLVLTSYGESYERSYPIYKGITLTKNYSDPIGPIYVSLGAASPFERMYNFSDTKEDWLAFRYEEESDLTFGRLNIQNESILAYEQVSFDSGNVVDSFTIIQEKHGKFSTSDLPPSVKATLTKQIIDAGENPDDMNIKESGEAKPTTTKSTITKFIEDIKSSKDSTKIFVGVGVAAGVLVLLIGLLIVRRVCRGKRRRSARRWENMDINYGKRYYSKANDKDDFDNDFEIDVPETSEPSRKLLTDD